MSVALFYSHSFDQLRGRPSLLYHYTNILGKPRGRRKTKRKKEQSKTKTPTEGYGISGCGNNFFSVFLFFCAVSPSAERQNSQLVSGTSLHVPSLHTAALCLPRIRIMEEGLLTFYWKKSGQKVLEKLQQRDCYFQLKPINMQLDSTLLLSVAWIRQHCYCLHMHVWCVCTRVKQESCALALISSHMHRTDAEH